MSRTTSYRFHARGRVQGVFFRQSARQRAQELQLDGWVLNRDDGGVEGLAHGEPAALDALRDWLQHGPPAAHVDALDWQASDETPASGFFVRR